MRLAAGTRLGPYEIVSSLGAGGMGEVYRARDPRLGRDVAIKVITGEGSPSPDRLRRFEQEARAVAALEHPGILLSSAIPRDVSVKDAGTACGASVALQIYPFRTQFGLWPLEAAAGWRTARPSGRRTIERHVDVQPVGNSYREIR